MRRILIALAASAVLAACGDDDNNTTQQPTFDCTSYCNSMNATCTGTDSQYAAALLIRDCATYCPNVAWPTGTAGANSGNSLACRVTHVGLAAAEAAGSAGRTLHCGHAGPTGGATCGTLCENYCYLVLRNCGANLAGFGFTDQASCLTACAGFTFSTTGGINANGPSLQCRIYHAGAAGTVGPSPHCGHAQPISSGTVGGTTPNGPCN